MKNVTSEARYFYGYFFSRDGISPRRVGWMTWLAELCFEAGYKARYPRFRYLYKLDLTHLGVDDPDSVYGVQYESVNAFALRQCFQALKRFVRPGPAVLFIDMGSGAGRVLHDAALNGFTRSAGIEIAPAMCEIAESNLRRYLPESAQPRIVNANIRHVDLGALVAELRGRGPVTAVVCFMNNPFTREIVEVLAANLDACRDVDTWVVCIWKQYPEVLQAHGFEAVHEQRRRGRFTLDSFRIYRRPGAVRGKNG